jgi:DNA sulfur modification protein DndB
MFKINLRGTVDTINKAKSKGMMSTQIPVGDILQLYEIDHKINRDLSYNRLPALLKYIEKAESEMGIFLPALVFSYRGNPIDRFNRGTSTFELNDSDRLVIIDGQHRVKAMEKHVEKIKNNFELYSNFISNALTAQIYFGLSEEDERKLFSDINSNARRVSMSLVTQYDSRDIMNLLVQELYRSTPVLKVVQIELNKSKILRPSNQAFSTGVRLKTFISYLLFGKKAPSRKDEQLIKNQYDEIASFLSKFFTVFFSALPDIPGDVLKYVLGHEPIQNAVALYLNTAIIINDSDTINWKEDWESEVEQLDTVDWSVKNHEWNRWAITVNPVKGSYKGFLETITPEVTEFLIDKIS